MSLHWSGQKSSDYTFPLDCVNAWVSGARVGYYRHLMLSYLFVFRRDLAVFGLVLLTLACGGSARPPVRGVIERDIGSWKFRRYQQLTDVEVWVDNNKATASAASYVREAAERAGRVEATDVVSAFVTRYEHRAGVLRALAEFARRLAQDGKYTVDERSISGARVITVSGHDERWVLWASGQYVIKIGSREVSAVPDSLIEAYLGRYPSRLSSGILDGSLPDDPPPAGVGKHEGDDVSDPDDADDDNPTPDWEQYKLGDLPAGSDEDDNDDDDNDE